MSFRIYADNNAEYAACLRDNQIEHQGLRVTLHVPVDEENAVDEYGDPEITNRVDKVTHIIPLYKPYYELLSILGTDLENDLPLECLIKNSVHIPRETVFRLPVRNGNGELIDRFWRVIGTEIRHLELSYERRMKCVPARRDCIDPMC